MKQCLRVQLLLVFSLMLIPLASFSQSSAKRGTTPIPYPKLKSTGNSEADIKNHAKAVEVWKEMERKRLEYLRTNQPDASNTSSKPSKESSERILAKNQGIVSQSENSHNQRALTILDLPGYPKYITTGNPQLDEKNYQIAKAKWMEEHSDLYKQYVQQHSGHSGKLKRTTIQSGK